MPFFQQEPSFSRIQHDFHKSSHFFIRYFQSAKYTPVYSYFEFQNHSQVLFRFMHYLHIHRINLNKVRLVYSITALLNLESKSSKNSLRKKTGIKLLTVRDFKPLRIWLRPVRTLAISSFWKMPKNQVHFRIQTRTWTWNHYLAPE